MLKLCRVNNFFPSSSSRDLNALDRVGCETCSCSAALVMFSSLATAIKYRNVRISTGHGPPFLISFDILKMNIMIFIITISADFSKPLY